MADCVVLIPVLNRPHRAKPVAESIRETSDARIMFLCSPDDPLEWEAVTHVEDTVEGVDAYEVPFTVGPGDFARKTNLGYTLTTQPLIFLGADDLHFHPRWLEQAKAGLRPAIGVVGTNDLGSRRVIHGRHATHSLVTREYVEKFGTIDEPDKILHEGYAHNFVDDELVMTAKRRRAWAFAASSRVEHLHPLWRKSELDPTYLLGRQRFQEDSAYYRTRRPLWGQGR